MDFSKYASANPTRKVNKMLIPVTNFGYTDEGIAEFNEIYQYCLENISYDFVSTKSGGISQKLENWRGCRWLLTIGKTFGEIVLKNIDGRYYRFIIGYGKEKGVSLSGRQAFRKYCEELKIDGVDLNDHKIPNGKEVKETIPSPKIELFVAPERTYYNAHHLDLNSAFNAGMMKAFPFLEKSVRRMYGKRKENAEYKNVLNMTQGVMQSSLCGFALSHISKAGYVWTNNKIEELTRRLVDKGYRILSYNTDGIWYQGNEPFHDYDEGTDIGQWKNDHVNCKIRFKSKGAYEYEENGIYKPVIRGESSYEKIVPKDKWVWGDIFKGDIVKYVWVDGIGYYKENTI